MSFVCVYVVCVCVCVFIKGVVMCQLLPWGQGTGWKRIRVFPVLPCMIVSGASDIFIMAGETLLKPSGLSGSNMLKLLTGESHPCRVAH